MKNETLRDYEVQRMSYEDLTAEKELLIARLREIETEQSKRKKEKGAVDLVQIVTLLKECVEDLDMRHNIISVYCYECNSKIDINFEELLESLRPLVR